MGWESNSTFQVIIVPGTKGGVFVYSGAPAAGNLVATIAAANGTDAYGNAYVAGETSYKASTDVAIQNSGAIISFLTEPGGANGAGPWTSQGTMSLLGTALQANIFSAVNVNTLLSANAASGTGNVFNVSNTTATPTRPRSQYVPGRLAAVRNSRSSRGERVIR